MNNLFQLEHLFFALVVLSFTMVSCSKDDDSPSLDSSKFVGEWTVTGIYKDGKNVMPSEPVMGEDSGSSVTFTEDGMFGANFDIVYEGDEWTTLYYGTWKLISSNVIKLNGEDEFKVKKITDSQFDFEYDDEDYGKLEVRSVRAE